MGAPDWTPDRPLTPGEQELVARTAVLAGKRFAAFGWTWDSDERAHVPDAETIAQTLAWIIGTHGEGSTGRLLVTRHSDNNEQATEVYLHLGTLWLDDDGERVDVDDDLAITAAPTEPEGDPE